MDHLLYYKKQRGCLYIFIELNSGIYLKRIMLKFEVKNIWTIKEIKLKNSFFLIL
jgi:hypothetical protein